MAKKYRKYEKNDFNVHNKYKKSIKHHEKLLKIYLKYKKNPWK